MGTKEKKSIPIGLEQKEEKNLGQKLKSKAIIVLLIFFGFWIGWDLGAYGYIKYLSYVKEKQGEPWMNKYIEILKEQEEANKNDFYGGDTPEETINLFIAALKKGDYELASKYFVIDEQEKWRKMFNEATKQQNEDWAKETENEKNLWRTEKEGENKFVIKYNTGIGDDERTNFIYLKRNVNNKWKIMRF